VQHCGPWNQQVEEGRTCYCCTKYSEKRGLFLRITHLMANIKLEYLFAGYFEAKKPPGT